MLPNPIRNGLLLAALITVAPAASPAESLHTSQWKFTNPVIDGFSTIRATLDVGNNAITLQPNAATPEKCFGWVEGPRITVAKPTNTADGNIFQLKVGFTFNQTYTGTAPEMRLRINSSNFNEYANSAVTSVRFNELRSLGRGTVTATFDRRNLTADNSIRLYIDLFTSALPGQVDPNFYVRIDSIDAFAINAGGSTTTGDQISAAYTDSDRDLYVHINGQGEGNRRKIRSSVAAYAYDGAYIVSLDQGALHAFKSSDNFASTEVEGSGIVSVAIAKQHVLYINDDGEVHYYNIETKESRKVGSNTEYYATGSAGDGRTLLVYRAQDGNTSNPFRIYQLDTNNLSNGLQMIQDWEYIILRTRHTGYMSTSSKAATAPLTSSQVE